MIYYADIKMLFGILSRGETTVHDDDCIGSALVSIAVAWCLLWFRLMRYTLNAPFLRILIAVFGEFGVKLRVLGLPPSCCLIMLKTISDDLVGFMRD